MRMLRILYWELWGERVIFRLKIEEWGDPGF